MTPTLSIDAFLADYNAMRERAERAEAELAAAREAIVRCSPEALRAERDRALVSLGALSRQLTKIGGYATPEQQQERRDAKALLVEAGR